MTDPSANAKYENDLVRARLARALEEIDHTKMEMRNLVNCYTRELNHLRQVLNGETYPSFRPLLSRKMIELEIYLMKAARLFSPHIQVVPISTHMCQQLGLVGPSTETDSSDEEIMESSDEEDQTED